MTKKQTKIKQETTKFYFWFASIQRSTSKKCLEKCIQIHCGCQDKVNIIFGVQRQTCFICIYQARVKTHIWAAHWNAGTSKFWDDSGSQLLLTDQRFCTWTVSWLVSALLSQKVQVFIVLSFLKRGGRQNPFVPQIPSDEAGGAGLILRSLKK